MFSLFDKQTGDYKSTGLNSKTKEEAINDGMDLIYGSESGLSKKDLKTAHSSTLKEKELLLMSHDIIVDEHGEEIIEEDF